MTDADSRKEQRLALRRAAFFLVLGIVLVHALFLGGYQLGDVERASSRFRMIYTSAWMVTTGIVVAVLLRNFRKVRFGR